MTYEEALRLVKRGRYFSADEVIIKALEKQIPKKPKIEMKRTQYEFCGRVGIEYETIYRCPKCNGYIRKTKCCDNNDCGQRIDWSEVE